MVKLIYLIIIGLFLATFSSNAQNIRHIKTESYEGIVRTYSPSTSSADKMPLKHIATDAEIALMEKEITASITEIVKEYK
jgi:Skp family chaperone for outer membrane proteins